MRCRRRLIDKNIIRIIYEFPRCVRTADENIFGYRDSDIILNDIA